MPALIVAQLLFLEADNPKKEIAIYINSPGGGVTAGRKDLRFALPNARIMVHQPSGGFQGHTTDIMIHAQEILNLRKRLNEIYLEHTGQPIEKIEEALERDTFLTAEAAKDFGLVDQVIERRPGGVDII